MSKRFLNVSEIQAQLALGKSVEMFLGRKTEDGEAFLHWLEVRMAKGEHELRYLEVYDEGDLKSLDIYSFSTKDPDGEVLETSFVSLEATFDFIQKHYTTDDVRFVPQGMSQNEYHDLLESEAN